MKFYLFVDFGIKTNTPRRSVGKNDEKRLLNEIKTSLK